MSLEAFTDDPQRIKSYTNPESDGVNRSVSPQFIGTGGNPAPYYEVSVRDKPGQGSDQTITHTGPGAGVHTGIGSPTDLQGFVSPNGNKMVIDSTFGSDTITIQHHSGATVMIDADGSLHLVSTGKKGVGIIAPKGDQTNYARGHMILKGDGRITIETEGDLDINVGGNLNYFVKGDLTHYVKGSSEEIVDGSKIIEVVKDMSTTVAGDKRITVAGDMQTQVTGNKVIDTGGDLTTRSDGKVSINTQKALYAIAKSLMRMDTKETFTVVATGNMGLETKGNFSTRATGTTKLSSTGAASLHTSSTVNILGSGLININGSDTKVQTSGSPSVNVPSDASDAPQAQFAPANTIIDSVTSSRLAPDFPDNATRMSKEEFSLYKNEGSNPNPKAEAYAAGNAGSGIVPEIKSTGITAEPTSIGSYDRPAGVSSNNGKAEQNPLPIPSSVYNSNEKISKHLSVGNIINIRACPPAQQKQVLQEAMNVAWNILDPLIEHFSGRIQITSWWRNNSSNHIKGGAVDVRAANKNDVNLTAEIASYARDNLPYSKILLEKNDSPGIHCHLESAQPGQSGGGTVLTCADPKCHSAVNGLQLSYAVAALNGRRTGQA